jgi:hypothetical protein
MQYVNRTKEKLRREQGMENILEVGINAVDST